MKQLFLFSGLGADKRVFEFLDLSNYSVAHVSWIKPLPKESMAEYAQRLLPQIKTENPILVGVSFGGMIALEISKLISVEKVILISSAVSSRSIPSYFKFMARLNIQKLVPPGAFKKPNEVLFWLFGVTKKEHKTLLTSIMADTDESFFTWAIEAIMLWKNIDSPGKIIQIHGTRDRILDFKSADYAVSGGGHLMVVTSAKEVSDILRVVLA